MANGDIEDPEDYGSTVRNNLMKRPNYSPYCGVGTCMMRLSWNGAQFQCARHKDYVTNFPDDFIKKYSDRWHSEETT
jgi:hypothetical protein